MKGFKKFLLIYVIVFLILSICILGVLYGFLAAYEKSLPEEFVIGYVSDEVPLALLSQLSDSVGERSSDAAELEALKDLFRSSKPYKLSENCYSLRIDDIQLGQIKLKECDGSFGFCSWEVEGENYDLSPWLENTEILIPGNYSVFINGTKLGKEQIIDTAMPYKHLEAAYEDYPWLPRLTKYESGAHLGDLDIEILNESGETVSNIDEIALLSNCSNEVSVQIFEFCKDYIYRYMVFIGNTNGKTDENYRQLSYYVKLGGQLQQLMSQAKRILFYANTTDWELLNVEMKLCSYLGENRYLADICYESKITALGAPDVAKNYARLIVFMEEDGDLQAEAMYNYNA